MNTVENTRRELFEAWFESLNHYKPMRTIYNTLWYYDEQQVEDAWLIWNAALDSVVIELPLVYDYPDTECMRMGCVDAIESTNLGLKVK
jgi:hypothetical protein